MKLASRWAIRIVFFLLIITVSLLLFGVKNSSRNIFTSTYQASQDAMSIISEPSEEFSVEFTSNGDYLFYPVQKDGSFSKNSSGIIFYPGAMIDPAAYLPLMKAIASKGYFAACLKMPKNLAVFNKSAAERITKNFPEIHHWFIGGHSLGGSMAAAYSADKPYIFDGLILFASYSSSYVDRKISVLSLYGDCDSVLSHENYEKMKTNLPDNFSEYVIKGGCHSFFADYGMQANDGTPKISREEQITTTAQQIDFFIAQTIFKN